MRIVDSLLTSEGQGAEVQRLFPIGAGRMNLDPFVLWDHFMLEKGMGFPTHPHRGFEAITYIFEGSMEHKDNLGNHSRVYANGAQRFTAGAGLEHSEMPDQHQPTSGIQLWINLPKRLKSLEPAYQQVDARDIPERSQDGVTIRTLVGEGSPLTLHTPVQYLDVRLEPGAVFKHGLPEGYQGLVYLVKGKVQVNAEQLSAGQALYLDAEDAALVVTAEESARLMYCAGQPHHEPIHQWGPFVD